MLWLAGRSADRSLARVRASFFPEPRAVTPDFWDYCRLASLAPTAAY